MKNYLLILLSVLGVGLLISNINSTTPVSSLSTSSEIANIEEVPTLDKIEEVKAESVQEITATAKMSVAYTARTASHNTSSGPNYRVTQYRNDVQSHGLTSNDIYKTGKLIYGHNSNNLLGSIRNLSVGSIFTVTENGATNTYQVVNTMIFKKTGEKTLALCASGYENCSGTYYVNNISSGSFRGTKYQVALFTCDGTILGGGDATHRRVVFANKI